MINDRGSALKRDSSAVVFCSLDSRKNLEKTRIGRGSQEEITEHTLIKSSNALLKPTHHISLLFNWKIRYFYCQSPSFIKRGPPRGSLITQSRSFFFAFSRIYAINEKLGFSRKNAKIRRKKCFSRNYASFCRFHEIEHIFRRFNASRTQVDSRNHAKMKSFSWFHASKNPMGGLLKMFSEKLLVLMINCEILR